MYRITATYTSPYTVGSRVTVRSITAVVVALAIAAFIGLQPRPAHSNPYSVHAEGAVITGWSDNLANASSEPAVGENVAEEGFYTEVRPAVLFTYEAPRSVHVARAEFSTGFYQSENISQTYNGRVSYTGAFVTSPSSQLGLGTGLSFGSTSQRLTSSGAGDGAQEATLGGDTTFIQYDVNQSSQFQLNQALSANQNTLLSRTHTFTGDDSESVATSVGLSGGINRTWVRTALGLSAGVGYLNIVPEEDGETHQVPLSLNANATRDLSPSWSVGATLGLSLLYTIEAPMAGADNEWTPSPVASVTANYLRPVGPVIATFSGIAGYGLQTNLILGSITNTANATLRAGIPLPWVRRDGNPVMQVGSSLGFAHSIPIDYRTDSGDVPTWNSYTADAAWNWAWRDALTLAVRYQYVRTDVFEGDSMAVTPPTDLFRHTILLEMRGRFPERQAAEIRTASPRVLELEELDAESGSRQQDQRQ